MSPPPEQAPGRPSGLWQRRWVRYPAIAAAVYLIGCGLLALAVPLLLDRVALPRAGELLGRSLTIDRIRFDPFRLALTTEGLRLAERDGSDFVTIERFDADLSVRSLRQLAPVLESLRIASPRVRLQRAADGRFNFSDIVDRIAALPPSPPSPPDAEPQRFALYNIDLSGGEITLDDRMLDQRHEVEQIALGIPFVSNLPDDLAVFVEPLLAAVVDGSPLRLDGRATPFQDSRRTELRIDLRDLVLAPYLKWSPVPLAFRIEDGKLTTALTVRFEQHAAGPSLAVDGRARIDGLKTVAADGAPLAALRQLEVGIDRIEPLAGRYAIGELSLDGAEVVVDRAPDGSLMLTRAFTPGPAAKPALPATAQPPAPAAQPSAPATARSLQPAAGAAAPAAERFWKVRRTTVRDGRVRFTDRTVTPAVELDHRQIAMTLGEIGDHQVAPAPAKLSLRQNDASRLGFDGRLDLARSQAGGRVTAEVAGIGPYLPYLAGAVTARIGTGTISAETDFEAGWADAFTLALADGKAGIEALRIGQATRAGQTPRSGQAPAAPRGSAGSDPPIKVDRIAVEGVRLALAEQRVDIERALVAGADVLAIRDARGELNLTQLFAAPADAKPADAKPADAAAAAAPAVPGWQVAVARVDLEGSGVAWQDAAGGQRVTVPLSRISGRIERVGTERSAPSQLDLRASVGRGGQISARGSFVVEPLSLQLALQLQRIALAPFTPYLAERLALSLDAGMLSASGQLRYGGDRIRYGGRAGVAGLRTRERPGGAELLRWESLALDDIDVDLRLSGNDSSGGTGASDRIAIGAIALSDFFAKVELDQQGRFNLQDLVRPAPAAVSAAASEAAPAKGASATGPTLKIGGIRLERGRSNFTDRFVKPNYTVDLTDLAGTVSAMASNDPAPADVDVRARIDGNAPVEISGQLGPLGPTLFTDLRANAKGIDLPALTPYSGKYAGYAIEQGKLSIDVHYRIENEKLEAQNRMFLDQLTFGEKVDSPDALDLPIQFAIDLLKNSRGEIDVSLPLSGTLNDPQFSIGGLVWQAVKNLLTKIVTAPFSALAAAFGGSGEELSFVAFAPGTAELAGDSAKRLELIAKALQDRPALKLEIAGRVDPKAEADAFGRARLEQRLRALRAGGDAKAAAAPPSIPPDEYPALLKRLFDQTAMPDKPQGSIGKPVPPEQMERSLLQLLAADADARRELGTRRAQAARDWLTQHGRIAGDRIFLLAPRIGADGTGANPSQPQCTASCAEFSLR